jgi:uncharacterized membrane protein
MNHHRSAVAFRTRARRTFPSIQGLLSMDMKGLCSYVVITLVVLASVLCGTARAQNPVVLENQQPGTTAWQGQGKIGSDAVGQMKAYASATSVNKGGSITFYVSVNPTQTYTIDVYRLGWYQGLGGRLIQHIGPLSTTPQPVCPTDSTTGMIECHWAAGYTLATQSTWTSGVYLVLFTNAQGYENYSNFVLRDDTRTADLIYELPVNTYQAYNDYPYDSSTGKSLYGFNSYGARTVGGSAAAVKVSFDRPYDYDGDCGVWGHCVLGDAAPFIHWLEKNGYDITYTTDVDTHENGARLLNYKGFVSGGHNEYWSKAMYDNAITAVNGGVNLGFFFANSVYTQIRYEPSSSGVEDRVMVCYRDASIDPNPDPTLKTVNWRDDPVNRPEQVLVGVQYTSQVPVNAQGFYSTYIVNNSNNWVYTGTGFKNNDTITGLVGYEADRFFSQFPAPNSVSGTYTLLSHSPFTANGGSDYSNASVYQATSGAWVFASGTMNWTKGLDSYDTGGGPSLVDARIQQATTNILSQFIGNSPPDFALDASPSSQAVSPGSSTTYGITITPKGTFTGNVTLSVSGLPAGSTSGFSPNPATSSSTLTVSTNSATPLGSYPLTITAASGNLTHTSQVTLVVSTPDFNLAASPSSQTILQGATTTYGVTVNPLVGFNSQVTLSVSGLPTGATGSFSPNPTTSSSTLSVTGSATTPIGSYTLTITGVSGALTHSTTVTLVVATPDFSLTASPSTNSVMQGSSGNYSVTINPVLGFAGQVSLSVSGLPTGATGTFTPNPATATSNLSVSVGASTASGTYTLTITGVSGALIHTATVSLTVVPAGVVFDNKVSAGYQFGVTKVTTPAFTIGTGANRAAMIMVAMSKNTATNITASLGGVAGTVVPGTDTGITATIRTLIFQVVNPPSGSQTATVSWTTSMNADVGVITVTGASPTGPINNGTFFASNSSSSASGSVTVTSHTGDLTATIGYTADGWKSPFTNRSLKWGVDASEVGGDIGPGTGTTVHTWTDNYAFQTMSISGANFQGATAPDYSLSATPPSQTVLQGSPTSYNVSVNPANGFNGAVSLSVTGLPTAATGSFTPNPTTGAASLSVTTDPTTPPGNYTLTVTGTSGALTHNTTVTLVVVVPDFTVSASPSSQTATQGSSATYNLTITPKNGFNGLVTFGASGLPAGATFGFSPNPTTSSSTLTVTVGSTTPGGSYVLTITGTSGSLTHTTTVTLVVPVPDFSLTPSPASQSVIQGNGTSYNFTINPTNGFSDQVTFSVSGLPTGASGSFTPNPSTSSSSLSVTTAANTPVGTYTLTITGASGALTHTATVTLLVSAPPDFALGASPGSQTVVQGGSTSYGVTITGTNGFNGQVTLNVSGMPSGATSGFSTNPATSSSTLSVTAGSVSPVGSYTLTITGTSGTLTHTATVTLVVASPDFSLTASPSTRTASQGGSATYTITINPVLGFAGQVTLSATGLPTGASATFTPNPATASSSLVISAGSSTPTGTYTITILGVSGALSHGTTVSLTVIPAGVIYDSKVSSGYNWGVTKITTPAFTIGSGNNRAAMIMVAMSSNTATNVTASLGGVAAILVPGSDSGTTAALRTMIFQVVSPPSGSQTAIVSWTNSTNADVGVITVSGVNQTTPVTNGTFAAFTSNAAKTASLTVNSSPGDLTATIGYTGDGWATPFTNQILKWGVDSKAAGGDVGTGLGTTTHTWTDTYPFQSEVVSGANFKAATGQ